MTQKPWLDALRREMIINPVKTDPRTTYNHPLGHAMDWIFHNAIGGGQADFDAAIDDLSPADRALLYAYLNQPGHIDELIDAFSQLMTSPPSFQNATIVDVGCGPFTAGLALANVLGSEANFRYVGIDRAKSMCELGVRLADGARRAGELSARTSVRFLPDLDQFEPGQRRSNEVTVFVLSYLLASRTIDVERLGRYVAALRKRISLGPALVLYTNSTRPDARATFPRFKEILQEEGFETHTDEEGTVEGTTRTRLVHYALFGSPSITVLATNEFPG